MATPPQTPVASSDCKKNTPKPGPDGTSPTPGPGGSSPKPGPCVTLPTPGPGGTPPTPGPGGTSPTPGPGGTPTKLALVAPRPNTAPVAPHPNPALVGPHPNQALVACAPRPHLDLVAPRPHLALVALRPHLALVVPRRNPVPMSPCPHLALVAPRPHLALVVPRPNWPWWHLAQTRPRWHPHPNPALVGPRPNQALVACALAHTWTWWHPAHTWPWWHFAHTWPWWYLAETRSLCHPAHTWPWWHPAHTWPWWYPDQTGLGGTSPKHGPGGTPPKPGLGGTPPKPGPGCMCTSPTPGPGGTPPTPGPGGTSPTPGPGGTSPKPGPYVTLPTPGPGGTPPTPGPGGTPTKLALVAPRLNTAPVAPHPNPASVGPRPNQALVACGPRPHLDLVAPRPHLALICFESFKYSDTCMPQVALDVGRGRCGEKDRGMSEQARSKDPPPPGLTLSPPDDGNARGTPLPASPSVSPQNPPAAQAGGSGSGRDGPSTRVTRRLVPQAAPEEIRQEGKPVDVQSVVEEPGVYLLARYKSTIADQLKYARCQREDIKTMQDTNYQDVKIRNVVRYFTGDLDNSAMWVESGEQHQGTYGCPAGCDAPIKRFMDLGYCLLLQVKSLEDRRQLITSLPAGARRGSAPFKALNKDQLIQNLDATGYDCDLECNKPELESQLKQHLAGASHIPALLYDEQQSTMKAINLEQYEDSSLKKQPMASYEPNPTPSKNKAKKRWTKVEKGLQRGGGHPWGGVIPGKGGTPEEGGSPEVGAGREGGTPRYWDGEDVETEEWRLEDFIWCWCTNCKTVRECMCWYDLSEAKAKGNCGGNPQDARRQRNISSDPNLRPWKPDGKHKLFFKQAARLAAERNVTITVPHTCSEEEKDDDQGLTTQHSPSRE
ncbi:Hypp6132 [Branchiostoma lanceolatum]|uniref:Hypp6132 protein n=1 Tax=Branchiostoma lanceolatum TaxID=7740 RepID=A0A8J9W6E7_BRALA|nr:Hypp6132 [Branchiostoma lanceolatum]